MKFAITGGMGCGKSTVVKVLQELLPHYKFGSYDDEVKRLYGDAAFKSLLRKAFGTDQKFEIARIVFNDLRAMELLISLADAPTRAFMEKATSNLNVVLEVPMLFQIPGAPQLFDTVVAVWCDPKTQRERIRSRDGISDDVIDQKLKGQLSADEIASKADFVIDTSDGAVDVREQLFSVLRVAKLNQV